MFIDGAGSTGSTSVTIVRIRGLLPLPCTKAINSVVIGATNLGPLDDLEPFSFHVVPPNPMLEAWLAEAMENLDNDNWPALTEYARLVGGHESVYDLPVETTEVDESRREASLEITPISESKW